MKSKSFLLTSMHAVNCPFFDPSTVFAHQSKA